MLTSKKHLHMCKTLPPREVLEKYLAALRAGNFAKPAAALAGVNRSTLDDLITIAGKERRNRIEGKEHDASLDPHVAFLYEYEEALVAAESRCVNYIVAMSENTWQAAAWFLERRFPKRWRQKHQEQVEKHVRLKGNKADIEEDERIKHMTTKELDSVMQRIAQQQQQKRVLAHVDDNNDDDSTHTDD